MITTTATIQNFCNRNASTKQVLACDGGGVRGIITAKVLAAILSQMGGLNVPDVFDLVAGTSTGSLIGAACIFPDPKFPTKPLYTAAQVADFMYTNSPTVFHKNWLRTIGTIDGLLKPKYSATGLEQVINQLGDAPFSNLLTEALFPAQDTNNFLPFYFTTRRAKKDPAWKNLMLSQVLRSSTAAPYYFDASLLSLGKDTYSFIDGGTFANTPAVNAYSYAKELFGCGDNQLVLSLGTGNAIYHNDPQSYQNLGLVGVLNPLISGMINASQAASKTMTQQSLGTNFFRVEPIVKSDSLDDASIKNLDYLVDVADTWVQENPEKIEHIAKCLKEKTGESKPIPMEAYN